MFCSVILQLFDSARFIEYSASSVHDLWIVYWVSKSRHGSCSRSPLLGFPVNMHPSIRIFFIALAPSSTYIALHISLIWRQYAIFCTWVWHRFLDGGWWAKYMYVGQKSWGFGNAILSTWKVESEWVTTWEMRCEWPMLKMSMSQILRECCIVAGHDRGMEFL